MTQVFGPVASRRLGQSLGINCLPFKTCTYSCVYCQLGHTNHLTVHRLRRYTPDDTLREIQGKLKALRQAHRRVDTITFVSNGEPSLDVHIGTTIQLLQPCNIPIAVITNASLLDRPAVRMALSSADIVSVKVDSVQTATWQALNRPHEKLDLPAILEGIRKFAKEFNGKLISDTMLVQGLNDSDAEAEATAAFIQSLEIRSAYLGLPLRPPTKEWVQPPKARRLTEIYEIFQSKVSHVEIMTNLPTSELERDRQPIQKLLDILQVHPLEESEILPYLKKNKIPKEILTSLTEAGQLTCREVRGARYYLRTGDDP